MWRENPELISRMLSLLAAAMLLVQFLMASQRILMMNIRLFAVQSFLLAGVAAVIAYFHHAPHIYVAAGLTLALKVILVPWFLGRVIARIQIRQEIQPLVNTPSSLLICSGLTLMGYMVAKPFTSATEVAATPGTGHNALAVAISMLLMGFYLMITRRKALTQILALLTMENGFVLAAISLTYGMPMVVELGVFFDVFVAVMVFGVLVYRIRETFDSMDVSKLSNLKG